MRKILIHLIKAAVSILVCKWTLYRKIVVGENISEVLRISLARLFTDMQIPKLYIQLQHFLVYSQTTRIPYSKKLWRSKSLAKRATARHWRKKLWRILTYTANHQSSINSKMKQFQTLMNTIKRTPYFPGFGLCYSLVACLMMAGDADGGVHCRVCDPCI